MARAWRCLAAALCLVPLALSAQPASNASGTLTVNGVTSKLQYAYAFHDAAHGATRVLVTAKPLTAALLAEEVALLDSRGTSALRDAVRKGETSAIELFVTPDGLMQTVMVFDRGFQEPTPSTGDDSYWYEPYRMTAGWTGARSRTKEQQEFFDTKWEYDVAYFAPVGKTSFEVPSASAIAAMRKEVEARETPRTLPPGGGEEGAFDLAFFKSLEAGNPKVLLPQMTPAMVRSLAEQMQVKELSPSDLTLWAMSLTTPPGKVE
ncbi:MAG TPA: hypothetical protein VGE86_01125, partial [Thermoanaerobaculia bacterium]